MRNDIPSDSASNFSARVRETLMTYLGKQGDPLDRGVTLRDLVESGIASLSNLKFGGGTAPLTATNVYVPDLTPPPTPTGFSATAAISNIIIQCDDPVYSQGHGHRLSRIYGATRASGAAQPVFADAVEITQFAGAVTSYSTNPATEWHLWIKWESIDGVLSGSPAGGTNGLVATTGQDVAKLLTALTGQLTATQLYTDLGARINLIDAAATVTGSVNARVATVQAQVNDIQNTPAYSNTTTYAVNALVSYNGSIYQALQTTTGNLPTNTTYWLKVGEYASLGGVVAAHTTQIGNVVNDLSAEVTYRQALSSQVNDATTGLPATRSTLSTNYYTKAATDSAISSATTTLVSTTGLNSALGNYTTTAGLVADYYTKTGTDSAISSATQYLVSTTALNNALGAYTNTATLTSNYYTKTGADSAISQATLNLVSTTALNNALAGYTNTATLNTLYYTKTGADSAISNATTNLVSTTALNNALGAYTNTASLSTNYYTKTDANTAISNATSTLVSTSGLATTLGSYPTTATLTTDYYTKTATDSAISSATSTLVSTSTLSGYTNTAALQTNYFTKASGTSLEGKYAVKVDLNGYVSGFGLASTANDAGATSTFAVRSDAFYIASPSGPGVAPTMPFIVRTTSTTIGGVEVPVGVYITDGYIQNGTITNAKIANLAVDNAKISSLAVDKLVAGSVSVGQYIQSSNYVAATSGWKINGDGAAEFGSASIRGQLTASQIDSRGLSIKDSAGNVILSAGSSLADSSFGGNVTGLLNGTAAATVVSTANSAASAASIAQGTANTAVSNAATAASAASTAQGTANTAVSNAATAASAASTAQGTANTAVSAASTAQGTANSAASAASTAQNAANSAASAASTAQAAANAAQTAADAKLAKSGAQILTGPVSLNAASAITVGTPALNSVAGQNGFYIGSTGIVGTKDGAATFTLDNAGNATFKGDLTGASGAFSGSLSAATGTFSGALSAATGTFSGALSAATGTFSGSLSASAINAVETINIAGNAVTVPVYVTLTSNLFAATNATTLLSGSMNTGGQPVFVFYSIDVQDTAGSAGYDIQVLIAGTVVKTFTPIEAGGGATAIYAQGAAYLASPGIGAFNIQLRAVPTGTMSIYAFAPSNSRQGCYFYALGTKR